MDTFLHSLHTWQQAALAWLAGRDPLTVDLAMLLAMTLEGMGIPGIPGEVPMLAQAALIHAGVHSYWHAAVIGTIANFLGSLLGYELAARGVKWFPARWRHTLTKGAAKLNGSRHAGWLILLSRSFGALRTPITWGAGAGRYPFGPYAVWAFVGAVIHVFAWQYALWKGTGWFSHLKPHELLWAGALALVAGLAYWLWRQLSKKEPVSQPGRDDL